MLYLTKRLLKISLAVLLFGVFSNVSAQNGLVGKAVELPTLILSSGEPLGIEVGVYYEIIIQADGSA